MWQEMGVDRMVFILNAAGAIPQEKVMQSLRLFADHVMPAFEGASRGVGSPVTGAAPVMP
jgi:hypothetical protein